ncbi:hypothetical protein H4R34_006326, partial [Dimargaris verticillata]
MSGPRRNATPNRRGKRPSGPSPRSGLGQDRYTDGPTDSADPDLLSGRRTRRRHTGPRGGRDAHPRLLRSRYEGGADDNDLDGDVAMGDGPKGSMSSRHSPYGSRSRTRGRSAPHANHS